MIVRWRRVAALFGATMVVLVGMFSFLSLYHLPEQSQLEIDESVMLLTLPQLANSVNY